jgi:hypothetical protein
VKKSRTCFVTYPYYSSTRYLNERVRKIVVKVAIPETRRRIPEVRVLNRSPRRSRHTLPRNRRLLTTLLITRNQLVIHGPNAHISNFRPRARQRRVGVLLVLSVCGDGDAAYGRGVRGRGQPDDDVLPVVAMPKAGRRRIFGHVPTVHDGKGIVVSTRADVDLASRFVAVTVGGTCRGETSTVVVLISFCLVFRVGTRTEM